ncbi:uncharacterized protein BYT42DRAFT_601064 [Radiomyces spectabilis]|uniref:uncharacterized protein n=1 Tax=Radiomyces spectabilis TaxID=64574 RepID=UPI00221E4699|nr:uncharacterized protein BYT42DRAFT_601064 [Radiomyces spectabilis]KAI8393379.1 hypothetical protein BYT42DRAFT_601064 [Radiomyces spectabilis]
MVNFQLNTKLLEVQEQAEASFVFDCPKCHNEDVSFWSRGRLAGQAQCANCKYQWTWNRTSTEDPYATDDSQDDDLSDQGSEASLASLDDDFFATYSVVKNKPRTDQGLERDYTINQTLDSGAESHYESLDDDLFSAGSSRKAMAEPQTAKSRYKRQRGLDDEDPFSFLYDDIPAQKETKLKRSTSRNDVQFQTNKSARKEAILQKSSTPAVNEGELETSVMDVDQWPKAPVRRKQDASNQESASLLTKENLNKRVEYQLRKREPIQFYNPGFAEMDMLSSGSEYGPGDDDQDAQSEYDAMSLSDRKRPPVPVRPSSPKRTSSSRKANPIDNQKKSIASLDTISTAKSPRPIHHLHNSTDKLLTKPSSTLSSSKSSLSTPVVVIKKEQHLQKKLFDFFPECRRYNNNGDDDDFMPVEMPVKRRRDRPKKTEEPEKSEKSKMQRKLKTKEKNDSPLSSSELQDPWAEDAASLDFDEYDDTPEQPSARVRPSATMPELAAPKRKSNVQPSAILDNSDIFSDDDDDSESYPSGLAAMPDRDVIATHDEFLRTLEASKDGPESTNKDKRRSKGYGQFKTMRKPKPTNRYNPFLQYNQEHRNAAVKEFPYYTSKQISRLMGDRWKALSKEEKAPYYDRLKEAQDALSSETKYKQRNNGYPPNGFILYSKEAWKELRSENPELKLKELNGIISARWKALPKEEQDKYKAKSKELREQFTKEHPEFVEQYHRRKKELWYKTVRARQFKQQET